MNALDRAVRSLRAEKDPRPAAAKVEVEIFPDGAPREIATAFLRNGECPLACVYCALYRQTDDRPATGREIAAQIDSVRRQYPRASGLKLYNASSFFEPRSIDQSEASLREIADALSGLDLVVVEARSENASRAVRFGPLLTGRLEVAIGVETADDALLRLLNKPTSVASFRRAAAALAAGDVLLRTFVLAGPPFVGEAGARRGAVATFEEARRAGARIVSILPVVSEHEPMEALRRAGFFSEISLDEYFETLCDCAGAAEDGSGLSPVLLAEAEALDRLPGCPGCRAEKTRRLAALNATGRITRFPCPGHRPVAAPPVRRPRVEEIALALERART